MSGVLAYRRAEPRDRAFCVQTWLDSYRTANTAGLIAMEDWRSVMEPQLARILDRPGVAIWVAYHPAETDPRLDLYGWLAVERGYELPVRRRIDGRWTECPAKTTRPLVHYVFVKQAFRRMRIARGLFAAADVDPAGRFNYTCRTPAVSQLAGLIPQARWMPLIARYPKHETNGETASAENRADSRPSSAIR